MKKHSITLHHILLFLLSFTLLASCKKEEPVVPFFDFRIIGSDSIGIQVEFINKSQGGISQVWDFGDGSKPDYKNEHSPIHTYVKGGTYNVTLTVLGNSDIEDIRNTVEISSLIADFEFIIDSTSITTVRFVDKSQNVQGEVFYTWDFGDGDSLSYLFIADTLPISPDSISPSSPKTPHEFPFGGNFNVTLTLIRDTEVSQRTKTVSVGNIIADFDTIIENPITRLFIPRVEGPFDKILWDFGDGNVAEQSSADTARHQYTQSGIYTVKMIVQRDQEVFQVEKIINIQGLEIDFSFQLDSISPTEVRFTSEVTSLTGLTYQWDFGDGETSTEENPTHKYEGGGIYIVQLTVARGSDFITVSKSVNIPSGSADFIYENDSTNPVIILFTSQLSDTVTAAQYSWDFGDGSPPNSDPNPSHTFIRSGVYSVQLTVTQGQEIHNVFKSVIVPSIEVEHEIIMDSNNVTLVQFHTDITNAVGGIAVWDFGDGTDTTINITTITQSNTISHQYLAGGIYVPELSVTRGAENVRLPSSLNIPNVIPDFEGTVNNYTVTFNDLSENVSYGMYLWDYGDGTTSTNSSTHDHTYAVGGVYTVRLTISQGSEIRTIARSINIAPLVASFTISSPVCTGASCTVDFTDNSFNLPNDVGYLWDFGDGTTSITTGNVQHTYTSGGNYDVTLVLTNQTDPNLPENSIDVQSVTIPILSADFSYYIPQNCFPPCVVQFQNESLHASPLATYEWNFGDGSPSNPSQNPSHTYQNAFTYNVTLTVLDGGYSSEIQKSITITPPPPQPVNLNSGLIAYYPLDNNALDVSNNGNDGDIIPGPGVSVSSPAASHLYQSNKAYAFPASPDYIYIDSLVSLTGSGSKSFSIWVQPQGNSGVVFADSSGFALRYTNQNQYIVDIAGATLTFSGSALGTSWRHLVLVIDTGSNEALLYEDGTILPSAPQGISGGINGSLFQLGRRYTSFGYQYFHGVLDDFRVYNRVLNSDEVEALSEL